MWGRSWAIRTYAWSERSWLVVCKLFATVIPFRGLGQHLNNHRRKSDGILLCIVKLGAAIPIVRAWAASANRFSKAIVVIPEASLVTPATVVAFGIGVHKVEEGAGLQCFQRPS